MKQKNWKTQALNTIIVCMISFIIFNFLTTVSLNIFIPAVAELKNMSTASLYNANTIGNLISVVFALSVDIISKKASLKFLTVIGLFIGGISYILIHLVPKEMTGIFLATNYIATMFYAQITVGARIGNWYPIRKGEILGIVTAVITLSSFVWLPLFSKATGTFGIAAHEKNSEVPEHLYPHLFRHSRSMHLYQNGMPLPLLAECLIVHILHYLVPMPFL
ncbi:MAG: hypothetical protein WBJ13_03890 [Sedimentibacter sp.]